MVAIALAPLLIIAVLMTDAGGPAAAGSNQQSCVPPPGGLVSWWTGDGNAVDIWQGNDGTLVGDTTFAAGVVGDSTQRAAGRAPMTGQKTPYLQRHDK